MLSPLEVYAGSRRLPIGGPRQRAILSILLINRNQISSVEEIIDKVWHGAPPSTGRTQVAICVAALRKTFRTAGCDEDVIVTVAPGYMLSTRGHRVDAEDFLERVAEAESLDREGQPERAAQIFEGALQLWRGTPLGGINVRMVEDAAVRLIEMQMSAVEKYMALRLQLGDYQALIGDLTALVQAHPLRDRLRSLLMMAQYRAGRRADALGTYHDGRRHSIEELGLDMVAPLQSLHEAILREDEIALNDAGWSPRRAAAVVPAQLPSNVFAFSGRLDELRTLNRVLDQPPRGNHPVRVSFITGSPGIGKTSLAIHWAHQRAEEFPDGHLFADLGAYGYARAPESPESVLRRFLTALGHRPEQIPTGLAEATALYRTTLEGRRALIVLDDVHSFGQIRPLLPGNGQCHVLVTSRNQLEGLLDNYDALRLQLGILPVSASTAILRDVVGRERITSNPQAARRLSELCGNLPIAVRVAAARLLGKPHWRVSDLVARLEDRDRRLDELSHGEYDIRLRFETSWRQLDPPVATAYSRLALLDEPHFDAWCAAKATELRVVEAQDLLERLVDLQLLDVVGRGEAGRFAYGFQDLLLLYARERVNRGTTVATSCA
ncbi:BTAD domain-containing putative transcriptional regulator [Micromonospora sp. NPDC005215]|uniref:AfsR/SARP family transcriptional regulator n=1 Tax=Micromonospora sp. NPDC005215 TaxID=3157024 RepID=UPI00339DD51D